MGALVRVTDETLAALRDLSQQTAESMQDIVAKAVEAYRRQQILELSNAAYAALKADPQAWQDMRDERAVWDVTLADGLEDEVGSCGHAEANESDIPQP